MLGKGGNEIFFAAGEKNESCAEYTVYTPLLIFVKKYKHVFFSSILKWSILPSVIGQHVLNVTIYFKMNSVFFFVAVKNGCVIIGEVH